MSDATDSNRWTVQSLAERLGGRVTGAGERVISGINSLADARPDQITFAIDQRRAEQFNHSRAAALLLTRGLNMPTFDLKDRAVIEVADAEQAVIDLLEFFDETPIEREPGVHPSAVVDPSATVDPSASIGPHVTIEQNSTIGPDVILHAGVRIGRGVSIGARSVLWHNCVVRDDCIIGSHCILHNGVSIGADGFNYRPTPDGSGLRKIPHLGNVVLGDHIEIGANSCVDRGKFGPTTIGDGTKIDNLVQIGHNCRIGKCVLIAGVTGIAGSVEIGDGAMIGGQAAIGDHAQIGAGARIGGNSGVLRHVGAGETVFGTPALPRMEILRQTATLRRLRDWMAEVEGRLKGLETGADGELPGDNERRQDADR